MDSWEKRVGKQCSWQQSCWLWQLPGGLKALIFMHLSYVASSIDPRSFTLSKLIWPLYPSLTPHLTERLPHTSHTRKWLTLLQLTRARRERASSARATQPVSDRTAQLEADSAAQAWREGGLRPSEVA